MHDERAAEDWYQRLNETLATRGLIVGSDTPGAVRVSVPWRPNWGFSHVESTPADADAAVEAAADAQREWSRDEDARRRALAALADVLEGETDLLINLISFENGKLLPAATMEVRASMGSLRLAARTPIPSETLREDETGRLHLVREPIGVVLAITPANMPLLMLVNKLATAALTGNTVVAKPSPYTPLSALLLESLAAEAFPPHVFQVVTGGAEIGALLVENPKTGMITLTGSRRAGKAVMAAAARNLTRVQLELGGNDPAIILPDADLDTIAPHIFRSAFSSSGQACVATKRVYVPAEMIDGLTERVVALADASRVGSPYDAEATHPALTNRDQYQRVVSLIDSARQEGANVLTGGAEDPEHGLYIRPTVVTGLGAGSALVDEEQFGPVVPLIAYDDLDDLVETLNGGPYGLGATIWTGDEREARPLTRRLDVGMAWVNRTPMPDPTVPFGGTKESGIGREGGAAGLDAFCELKVIGLDGARRG
ncbi:aldehyde dehydrogenase family protein [Microbacterium sp. LRZ72]|uniref:aldehyde dehydrogenase family protein n=1 Tax=Microbacterium sp. LRZ72 TaxID=2942481 RepID=UPI0029B96EF2|nr:aldehyde dehydrogenase family protein [Microbacterium sp. LRZ72]MDX2376365.1 aldehyde dehydrogenase family protein [Microbacterium sp. LRZ72]